MQKTAIEWVKNPDGSQGFSCNPFSGLCPVGCWYCWGKGFVKRFKEDYRPMFWQHRLDSVKRRKKPAGIFMCSKFELFHPIIKKWGFRDEVFETIENCPQHRFYILTKFPQNIDREMPDNVWLGRTFTFLGDYGKKDIELFKGIKAKIKFLSIEPMMAGILSRDLDFTGLDWIICGRLTGYKRRENDPLKDWIEWLIEAARRDKCKIFLKDNLKEIWGDDLIQELPEG